MKYWLSGLLAALLLLSLTACGGIVDLSGVPSESESARLEQEKAGLPSEAPAGPENPADLGGYSAAPDDGNAPEENSGTEADPLPENGTYTSKDDVALYIHLYGHLPDNFISKKEAQDLGWPGGSLEPYAPGMCIGGSRFGNYEGLLPDAEGRRWTECDIDTLGAKSRGAKRIVFSNDGLVYYTADHYESFELLYGAEGDG